ncbi:MAG: translation elongation factor Ts [Cyanobacteria bacterium P01_H01_bin.74]
MSVTASQVKELRESTGAGMMDAKKALVEADGDMEKAAELLRQKGIATAEKKSGRVAAEGQVVAAISDDKKMGVLVEINCETDFVAKGDAFLALSHQVADEILSSTPESVDVFLMQPSMHLSGKTVKDFITDKIASIKENITIRRFSVFQCDTPGGVHAYIHTGGRVGVLIQIAAENEISANSDLFLKLLKDLAMQVASASPDFISRDDISSDVIEEETRVEMGKDDLANKPEDIRRKIVDGRVSKILGQRCLMEQPFIKDPAKSVLDILKEASKILETPLTVKAFSRYALGEGIEKEESNFAAEVAAAIGQ